MSNAALHERVMIAVGTRPFREVARLTRLNPETVRRYMRGQAPKAEFLSRLCSALDVSGDWLLTGRDRPPHVQTSEARARTLRQASAPELLLALGEVLTSRRARARRNSHPTNNSLPASRVELKPRRRVSSRKRTSIPPAKPADEGAEARGARSPQDADGPATSG